MDTSENSMKLLHTHQLAIAVEIRKICVRNDLEYFIIAGTLLGAVRHKGFIPWDDDMDIGMLRSDYDKFVDRAAEELPDSLVLQTWHSDPGFGLPMAKVRATGTRFIEQNSLHVRGHKGIFVDVFPFDEVPASSARRKYHELSTYILKRLIATRLSYSVGQRGPAWKKAALKVLELGTSKVSTQRLVERLEYEMRKFNRVGKGNLVAIGGSYGYQKETLKREWVQELSEVEFENLRWPCFEQWDTYLEHMYGDYMQLPPAEGRGTRHSVVEIGFRTRSDGDR